MAVPGTSRAEMLTTGNRTEIRLAVSFGLEAERRHRFSPASDRRESGFVGPLANIAEAAASPLRTG